jgi:hypothetical protein
VSLVATLGLALVAVVGAQVIASIIEGFVVSADRLEPRGLETDLLHRLGFPFGNLGPTAMLLLVVGLGLMCLPGLLGQDTTPLQDRLIRIALVLVVVLAAIVAVGSLLAVRYSLHEYTVQGQDAPQFIRVGFAAFLLGTLGTSATALFGALAAMSLRRRRTA